MGEDAIYGELDAFPDPTHQFLFLRNVTKKDGKPLSYLMDGAQSILYAWHRITFVEIMADVSPLATVAGAEHQPGMSRAATAATKTAPGTTVLGFFRDDT
jgi:hypothetical protein